MLIKDVLDTLDHKEKRLLMYAFEHDLTQYINLEDGQYIGVNTNRLKHLVPDQEAGVWSIGKVKNGKD